MATTKEGLGAGNGIKEKCMRIQSFYIIFNDPCDENSATVKKCAKLMIPLVVGSGSRAHLSCGSTWKDGFDHDSSAPAPYDAKAEPLAVIGQLNQLHVAPLTCWRLKENGRGHTGGK